MEENEVISAWNLWKNNLIENNAFFEILFKIKGNPPKTYVNSDVITEKQRTYILKLIKEGKIPDSQSLNLTKLEAQMLIQRAILSKDDKKEEIPKELFEDTTNW